MLPDISFDGQLVSAVSEGHKRALEGMAVDGSGDFDQASGTEEFYGVGPDDLSPSALGWTLLQLCGERFVEHVLASE